jgi:hypothetical protein
MMRAILAVGIAAVTLAGIAAPAHAGGKRLPKAVSLVERIRGAAPQTHYVRTASTRPAPAQSGVLTVDRSYGQTHYLRETPPVR